MNRVQSIRSSITGNRPTPGTRAPGELYANFADNALGVIDVSQNPVDLIAVRYWSVAANYSAGSHVIYNGSLYYALVSITAGAFNPAQWQAVSGGGGSGVPEAPTDGRVYARDGQTAAWVASPTEAPTDSQLYGRKDAGWVVVPSGGGVPEAPTDSQLYGRKNAGWVVVPSGGVSEAPTDGRVYTRQGSTTSWVAGVPEAPTDGQQYARTSTTWTVVSTGTGGIPDAPNDGTTYGRRTTSGAGAWIHLAHTDITDWTSTLAPYALTSALAGYLPLSGGTLTGDLTVAESSGNSTILIKKVGSTHLAQLEGWSGSNVRWDLTLGDQTPETGGNVGSDFSLNAFADGAVDGSTPLFVPIFVKRSTGLVSFPAGDPVDPNGAATKHYVDTHSGSGANPNRIDNGDMLVNQRVTVSVLSNGTQPVLDRWWAYGSTAGSKYTAGQNYVITQLPPQQFSSFLGVKSTSAYSGLAAGDAFVVHHSISIYDMLDLGFGAAGAQSITLSFWAITSLTGGQTFAGSVQNCIGLAGSPPPNRSYVFTYSLPTANVWTPITVNIPGDVTGTWLTVLAGLTINFSLGCGSTFKTAAGSWVTGDFLGATGIIADLVRNNNATWGITGVKLEAGSVATPVVEESIAIKYLRCQQYYQQLSNALFSTSYGVGATGFSNMFTFTPMLATPTISLAGITSVSNCTGQTASATDGNSGAASAVITGTGGASFRAVVQISCEF